MLEKLIKKDKNEVLENILEQKKVDEKTKNLLQGILYKIEDSYKDYKTVKAIEKTEEKFINELIENIKNKTNRIQIVNFNLKIKEEEIEKLLQKDKYYIKNNNIIAYPIEKKILYAIEKNSNNYNIINGRYGFIVEPISNLIMTGKNIDRIEVLRDFNGWAWSTSKEEIENIKANLIYQTLQILLGKDFLDDWTDDMEGIIDYYYLFHQKIAENYGEEFYNRFIKIIEKISIIIKSEQCENFKKQKMKEFSEISQKTNEMNDIILYVSKLTEKKKNIEKKMAETQISINSQKNLKEKCWKANEELPFDKKIFNVKIFKKQLDLQMLQKKREIDDINSEMIPYNYFRKKKKIIQEKELLETIYYTIDEKEELYTEFEYLFLECFEKMIKVSKEDELIRLIYNFRYYILLPFDEKRDIKDVEELKDKILGVKKELLKNAKKNKIISNEVSFEIWEHIIETRIIDLKKLYYKVYEQYDKKYIQIFDENISEEKYLINDIEKNKMNKKIKVFI